MPERVAFIGSADGWADGRPLARAGHPSPCSNRSTAKRRAGVEQHPAPEARRHRPQAAADAAVVFVCVGKRRTVATVATAPGGALHGMRARPRAGRNPPTTRKAARETAAAAAMNGVGFVDAPVSAANGPRRTAR